MSIGLIALLDDIAALAKVAAASIDDLAAQAAEAGMKAAGVVIDDAAVVPRYAAGFAAAREIPIVARIAVGSLRNKLLILLPAALALSLLAPWAVTPLLMLGGSYLCYEGTEKIFEVLYPNRAHAHEARLASTVVDPQDLEDAQVASAIKTDFILSAEIMAITLATIPEGSFLMRTFVLAIVGAGITVVVYAAVALIVKADDIGFVLARTRSAAPLGRLLRTLGRGVVRGMPGVLRALSVIGTAAMLWVGGSIVGHGLEEYGISLLAEAIQHAANVAAGTASSAGGIVGWMATALGWGIAGVAFGAALIALTEFVLFPARNVLARQHEPS